MWNQHNDLRGSPVSWAQPRTAMSQTGEGCAIGAPGAASGWYLLIPPRSEYNERAEYLSAYKILDTKPLSQWGQQGAYDSASECEAVRHNLLMVEQRVHVKDAEGYIKAVGAGTDPVVLKNQRWLSEMSNANESAFLASRCIRSDDVRLRP